MDESVLDDAKRKIISAVETRWSAYHSAYLLSQIGKDFPDEVQLISRGRKLLDGVRVELADCLTLTFKGEGSSKVWAVAPSSANEIEASKQIPSSDQTEVIRWNPAIWAAFRVPLPPNKKRVLQQSDRDLWFEDLTEDQDLPPETVLQLRHADIADSGDASSQVSNRITSALSARGLSSDRFTAGRSAPILTDGVAVPKTSARSLLDELLACLSPSEAKRVSVPLDVVLKLHKHVVNR